MSDSSYPMENVNAASAGGSWAAGVCFLSFNRMPQRLHKIVSSRALLFFEAA